MGFESIRWTLVWQYNVRQTIGQGPTANIEMHREWLGGWLDLWIGSQSIQRRNVGSHTGVGWQIASQTTRCLDNVFGRIEHVAKKTSLLVAVGLLVQLRLL